MILMPQIFDVTANENARYKRNELEYSIHVHANILRSGHQRFKTYGQGYRKLFVKHRCQQTSNIVII